jgi:tetratricopeptide (TPR) repeat protein
MKSKNQLLGYAALAYYHSVHPVNTSPKSGEIQSVGYIFPMSLRKYSTSITDFTGPDRLGFVERLRQIQNESPSPSVRQPLTEGGRLFLESKKIMVLMERGVTLLRNGHYEKAEEVLKSALVIAPYYVPAAYHVSQAILASRGLQAAESYLSESILNSPNAAFAENLRATLNLLRSQGHP